MDAIKVRKRISGETVRIPQLARLKGKTVNIVIYPDDEGLHRRKKKLRIPGWIGKYTTYGDVADDRESIYSR